MKRKCALGPISFACLTNMFHVKRTLLIYECTSGDGPFTSWVLYANWALSNWSLLGVVRSKLENRMSHEGYMAIGPPGCESISSTEE